MMAHFHLTNWALYGTNRAFLFIWTRPQQLLKLLLQGTGSLTRAVPAAGRDQHTKSIVS